MAVQKIYPRKGVRVGFLRFMIPGVNPPALQTSHLGGDWHGNAVLKRSRDYHHSPVPVACARSPSALQGRYLLAEPQRRLNIAPLLQVH